MAKFIKEHHRIIKLQWCNKEVSARIWVEEFATTWRVSAQIMGHTCMSAEQWKYTKKECKTLKELLNKFTEDYNEHWR